MSDTQDGFHPEASDTLIVIDPPPEGRSTGEQFTQAQIDYFGFEAVSRFILPDGVSWVDLKVLNEGERRRYLNETNRELKFAKSTGDAHVRMRPGDDRHVLLRQSIVGWNIIRNGLPFIFNTKALDEFLQHAPPAVIDLIEKEIRKLNPWLLGDVTLEALVRERDSLNEQIEAKEREEAGSAQFQTSDRELGA